MAVREMLSFEIAAVHNLCLDLPHLSQQNCFGEHKVVLQIESILCFFYEKNNPNHLH